MQGCTKNISYINTAIGMKVAEAPMMKHSPGQMCRVAGYVPLYIAVPSIPPID